MVLIIGILLVGAITLVGIAMLKGKSFKISIEHTIRNVMPTQQELEQMKDPDNEKDKKEMLSNMSDIINGVNKFMLGEDADEQGN